MRIFGGVFMGIIFLTVGIILLLNSFFNFNISVFKLPPKISKLLRQY
ncbi:unnamed protein product [marine sediment metagenome]|uniref:Uncharacterized protein n=1 Tax=marine sediment metagenome TaxID=412755 RepID=X1SWN2_9ZZZZ